MSLIVFYQRLISLLTFSLQRSQCRRSESHQVSQHCPYGGGIEESGEPWRRGSDDSKTAIFLRGMEITQPTENKDILRC